MQSLVIGGAVSFFGGVVTWIRTSGYDVGADVVAKLRVLSPWQYVVVRDIARRMVAPDRAEGVPSADDVGVALFIDAYLVDMRASDRNDVLRLLRFVEQLAPFGSGFAHRFSQLPPGDQDRVLAELEASGVDALRAGFQALKGLVVMAYYRDPRTFAILGYRGPLILRETP